MYTSVICKHLLGFVENKKGGVILKRLGITGVGLPRGYFAVKSARTLGRIFKSSSNIVLSVFTARSYPRLAITRDPSNPKRKKNGFTYDFLYG